jgi:hypothetical protein
LLSRIATADSRFSRTAAIPRGLPPPEERVHVPVGVTGTALNS